MVFALRGFRIAMLAEDGFSKLLAVGLTFGFALQTFIIVGGVLRLIPLTGITLPFVSYGGSSVVANFVMLAGCCSSRTAPSRGRRERPNPHASRSSASCCSRRWSSGRRTGRRGRTGELAARQDNAIQRVAQFKIKRGLIRAANGDGARARTAS